MARLLAEFRQRRYRREFRIGPPPGDGQLRRQLEQLLTTVSEPAVTPAPELDEKALADAATNLWRAQRRLTRDGEKPTAKDRQTGRYLVTCREMLASSGLVIQDHDGDQVHPGRSIEVLTFEEDPALPGEVVRETVRPTIYLHDRRIQVGQVIVAGPPTK
jgi:hypothetical protein